MNKRISDNTEQFVTQMSQITDEVLRIGEPDKMSKEREDLLKLSVMFFENLELNTRCEYGGWGLDDKRPFGNSDVETDILEGLGYPCNPDHHVDPYTDEEMEYATKLYEKLGDFLKTEVLPMVQAKLKRET